MEGNPVNFLDPFGLAPWDTDAIHDAIQKLGIFLPILAGALIAISGGALTGLAVSIIGLASDICFVISVIAHIYDLVNATNHEERTYALVAIHNRRNVGKLKEEIDFAQQKRNTKIFFNIMFYCNWDIYC